MLTITNPLHLRALHKALYAAKFEVPLVYCVVTASNPAIADVLNSVYDADIESARRAGDAQSEAALLRNRHLSARPEIQKRIVALAGYLSTGEVPSSLRTWHEWPEGDKRDFVVMQAAPFTATETEIADLIYAIGEAVDVNKPRNVMRADDESVTDRASFVAFVHDLQTDLEENATYWHNTDLRSFLDALAFWVEDPMLNYYERQQMPPPDPSVWQTMARILFAASLYE